MKTGEKIQKLRKEAGLSQEDLASTLGISRQSIQKWESNQSLPDTAKLSQLSKVLNTSIDYLLAEDKTSETKPAAEPNGSKPIDATQTSKQTPQKTDHRKNAKAWIIVGMILTPIVESGSASSGGYIASLTVFFISLALAVGFGLWAIQKLKTAKAKSEIMTQAVLTLLFVSVIGAIYMFCATDSEFENGSVGVRETPKNAEYYYKAGDFESSYKVYRAIADNDPSNSSAWHGCLLSKTKNYSDYTANKDDCQKFFENSLIMADAATKDSYQKEFDDFVSKRTAYLVKNSNLDSARSKAASQIEELKNSFLSKKFLPDNKQSAKDKAAELEKANDLAEDEIKIGESADAYKDFLAQFTEDAAYYKKRNKYIIVTVSILCVTSLALGLGIGIPNSIENQRQFEENTKNYALGIQELNNGNYSSADSIFLKLGNFKDAYRKAGLAEGMEDLTAYVSTQNKDKLSSAIGHINYGGQNLTITYSGNSKYFQNGVGTINETTTWTGYKLITPSTKTGYTFNGWRANKCFYFNAPYLSIVGSWSTIAYTITYDTWGYGTVPAANPTSFTVESPTLTLLPATTSMPLTFEGWRINYSSGQPISSIPTGSTGNLKLVAYWRFNG